MMITPVDEIQLGPYTLINPESDPEGRVSVTSSQAIMDAFGDYIAESGLPRQRLTGEGFKAGYKAAREAHLDALSVDEKLAVAYEVVKGLSDDATSGSDTADYTQGVVELLEHAIKIRDAVSKAFWDKALDDARGSGVAVDDLR